LPTGSTDYVDASGITDWSLVQAARVTLTIERNQGGTPISRTFTHTVSMRGRQ
jgi:hypothetical protein